MSAAFTLPGFGPKRRAALAAVGILSPAALLHWAPRLIPAADDGPAAPGQEIRFLAQVESLRTAFVRKRGLMTTAILCERSGRRWTARWFKAPWIAKHLQVGSSYCWQGRCGSKQVLSLAQPKFSPGDAGSGEGAALRYENLPEGLGETLFRQAIAHCLATLGELPDPLGREADYPAVLRHLHQAEDAAAQEAARRICAERELLALQAAQRQRRQERKATQGRAWNWSNAQQQALLAAFPFALREDQLTALAAIRRDCAAPWPMLRLLQGEVGSGKTAVALAACLGVAAAGGQSLLLAPTAILAEQHLASAQTLSRDCGVALLTQETTPAERQRIRADLATGACRLLIGTHALLFDEAPIPHLALVVIDEQQRFGVEQRAALRARQPHWQVDCLLLSATPIPRSLARCAFGDCDLDRLASRARAVDSRLCAWPLERQQVITALANLAEDRCAFVIVPRRESDDDALPGCEQIATELAQALPQRRLATLHGGDDDAHKSATLHALRRGKCQILIATTVVEVGLDLPQAGLLIVLHAERYGLAQLHQLRGRIGRDGRPARALFCCADPTARPRLQVLLDEHDGLTIAERDLALRGPGDLSGTRQHGLPSLRCADLARDLDLLTTAGDTLDQLDPEQTQALLALFAQPPSSTQRLR